MNQMPQHWEEINSELFIFMIFVLDGFHGDSLASSMFVSRSYCSTAHLSWELNFEIKVQQKHFH